MPAQPQAQAMLPPQTQAEEKLELLKREEVRTMTKDIALVREQEAAKSKERIAQLKTTEQVGYKPFKAVPQPTAQAAPQEQTAALPAQSFMLKRVPSVFEKVFVRIVVAAVIVFALLNLVALAVWLFF